MQPSLDYDFKDHQIQKKTKKGHLFHLEIVANDCVHSSICFSSNPSVVCVCRSVQDQRVGEPENHRSSSRQSTGPAVRHVRGATGSAPTKQQTGQSAEEEVPPNRSLTGSIRTPFHLIRVIGINENTDRCLCSSKKSEIQTG